MIEMPPASLCLQSVRESFEELVKRNIQLDLLRLDLLHPIVNGNKWCKLSKAIKEAISNGCKALVSCGGIYSNHLHVLGYLGFLYNIPSYFIVRDSGGPSEMLEDLKKWKVELIMCSRSEYRNRDKADWWDSYLERYNLNKATCRIIPEGGSNLEAVQSTSAFFKPFFETIPHQYDEVLLPVGTGGTYAGVVGAVPSSTSVTGVSVVQKIERQWAQIQKWCSSLSNPPQHRIDSLPELQHYGKILPSVLAFIARWFQKTAIPLEPIYSGKLFFYIFEKIRSDRWPKHTRLLALHTGGLQSIRGQKKAFYAQGYGALWEDLRQALPKIRRS